MNCPHRKLSHFFFQVLSVVCVFEDISLVAFYPGPRRASILPRWCNMSAKAPSPWAVVELLRDVHLSTPNLNKDKKD